MKPVNRTLGRTQACSCVAVARMRGLTFVELMVVLAVLGVLVILIAVPAIGNMASRHRVQGVHAELLGDLQLARSEQAQRNGTSTPVAVTFGGSADVTCYLIHTAPDGVACDCTRAPGAACLPADAAQEIKLMTFARAAGVSVAASSPGGAPIKFVPPQGLVTPSNVVIDVQSATRGQLRTSISGLGVPTVCSPDGSIPGVRTC